MQDPDLIASLGGARGPSSAEPALRAVWHAARGEWDRAHALVQDDEGRDAAWVHAHLHRQEGDRSNAAYWYRRAGRPFSELPLEAERRAIAEALLNRTG